MKRPLQGEVRRTADIGRGFDPELVFSEPTGVEALVRAWLDDMLANDRLIANGHATVTLGSRGGWMIWR